MKLLIILFVLVSNCFSFGINRSPMTDLFFQISLGHVEGKSNFLKFGKNSSVGNSSFESIWSHGGLYNWLSATTLLEVASDDNSDTISIDIYGLDSDYNEINETITLTGQTPVTTVNSYLRVYRVFNSNSVESVGEIYLADDSTTWTNGVPDTDSAIVAQVTAENQQTTMAVYTVPNGKKYLIYDLHISSDASNEGDCDLMVRPLNKIFRASAVFYVLKTAPINTSSPVPFVVPEKTDIEVRCKQVSGTARIASFFNGILSDN